MGCFSYLCQECNTPINSDSIRGERCELFLLLDGQVIEHLSGEYDSYGRVFGSEWTQIPWNRIVELHYGPTRLSGIAAYHSACWKRSMILPVYRSHNDPNQGWGRIRKKYS